MEVRSFTGAAFLCIAPVMVVSASAQTATSTVSDAVELHLSATGQSVNRADFVTIHVPITTSGETASAARSANSAAITSLTNALVARGIDRGAVTLMPASPRFGFVGNEAFEPEASQTPQGLVSAMARKTAYSTLQIRLSDPALVGRVREVLDEQNQAMIGAPLYSLKDERAAKSAAISDALAKVRQDAETYAAPLGLRVERITSVSSYGDISTPAVPDPDFFVRMMAGAQESSTDSASSVTTRAQVWVNFVLVPR